MKKLLFVFICLYSLALATQDKELDTTDIRKYHQQLEEKSFELEENDLKDEKINESFLHGKRRIEDKKKNELEKAGEQGKKTTEELEKIEVLEKKYENVMTEYEKLKIEKERLIEENKILEKKLEKLRKK